MTQRIVRIVLTGAESTGKSTLAEALAKHYQCTWVPEYAREYVEQLGRHYTCDDVVAIARHQIEHDKLFRGSSGIVFFDTWLIITKVWFDYVFGGHPVWLDDYLRDATVDLFLVCDTDMPWAPDPVRENGGETRKLLQETYIQEIEKLGFPYQIVSGLGKERVKNAISLVDRFLVSKK